MKFVECEARHLPRAAALFNRYRRFYGQPDDLAACRAFLAGHLDSGRTRIFLLLDENDHAVAFAQLYPSFCSITLRPICLLSDLYVDVACRGKGYARHFMQRISALFKAQGVERLTLDTATSNHVAQRLYESLGYERESVYITYHQSLGA